ncbi:MAG: hypothetical protein PVG79_05320 [Gemmatimonadales bacterium]|jgi:hypothetical protein
MSGRVRRVFPVPPLEQLCIVLAMAGVVHGAPKYVEDAPIDRRAAKRAEPPVEPLRVGPAQVGYTSNTQILQVTSDTRPDARDYLQISTS